MGRFLIIVVILLNSAVVLAQWPGASSVKVGDRFYQAEQFAKAQVWYAAAVAQDSSDWYSSFRLGEALRQRFRYQEALPWYRRIHERAPERFPEATYYYALMLKHQGRCDEALPLLDRFLRTNQPKPSLAKLALAEQQGCYQATLGLSDSSTIRLDRLPSPLNNSAQDFAAVPYRHDSSLVFTSSRWQSPGRAIDYRFGENYTNLIAMERTKGKWKEKKSVVARWNTAQHDGPGCFNTDETQFYFTHCGPDYCRIYVSELQDNKWAPPRLLDESVNAPRSNSKHPALSAGGDTLYFVSDRAGGTGGTDLWQCARNDNRWGQAQNLGNTINTPADEISPYYYAPEDLFFFASQGRGGVGGMDLYGIPRFVTRPTVPLPLPHPFNTVHDDAFFALGQRQGFLASNLTGDFDIYQFTLDTLRPFTEQLFGASFLRTADRQHRPTAMPTDKVLRYDVPLPSASQDIVVVRSVPEEHLANGSSRFILNSNVNDIALRRLRDQPSSAASFTQRQSRTSTNPYFPDSSALARLSTDFMSTSRQGEVSGSLYRQAGQQQVPTSQAEVHLLDSTGAIVKITTTNKTGDFHFVNLDAQVDYSIALADQASRSDTTIRVKDLRVRESGDDIATIPYETLYFDFNQSALRPEARQALNDLADYFQQHSQTAIEINAFADSLGNDAYNLLLSQQRGESVFRYLLEQGVDPAALAINAQGISTSLSSTNSLVSQQLNRRVEIQLIGNNVQYYPRAETRILRPNVTAQQLYELGSVSYEELQQLNGRPVKQVTPLKPLRVPVTESPALDQLFFDINYQTIDEKAE